MTDRPMIAIILAVIVESAHWVRFRWDFDEAASSRVWQLTCVIIAFATVLIYLDGSPYVAMPKLLTWLPLLVVPMQFVQAFGMKNSMPIATFSFLAKQRRNRNLRHGLTDSMIHFNFGNAYFMVTMIGATLGSKTENSPLFLPCTIILAGWMLLSTSRTRPLSLFVALVVAGVIAVGGQLGLQRLEEMIGNRNSPSAGRFDPNTAQTMIGRPGKINQSPDIVWRIRMQSKDIPPRLLRTASYNVYRNGPWATAPLLDREFNDLDTRLFEEQPYYILAGETNEQQQLTAVRKDLPRYSLRGSATEETPLPLPGDAASLRDLEVDGIERNSFGTVRIFPKHSVVESTTLWQGGSNPEILPVPEEDMKNPFREKRVLEQILRELQLDEASILKLPESERPDLPKKLARIKDWFLHNFTYSRNLKILSPQDLSFRNRPTAIAEFLTTERRGHCEYFATATTLLLREANIPARYAIGYAVIERDAKNNEYVIRGTHGHAWTRVWDEQNKRWIDFDTTPASWTSLVIPPPTWSQRFNDSLKRIREDFFLWRNLPSNRLAATVVMLFIGLSVAGFVAVRLWKSKTKLEGPKRIPGYEGIIVQTALNSLERYAEKKLGPRPSGKPFAKWLEGLHSNISDPAALKEAISLHQRLRFDPAPPTPGHPERLIELAKSLEIDLKKA